MNGSQIRKITLEALIAVVLSVLFLVGGSWFSADKARQRIQNNYQNSFGYVLPASYYSEVDSELIDNNDAVNNVYIGYDDADNPIGFVLDVTVTDQTGRTLHLYTGVTYEGALLTGIKRIGDETNPIPVSEQQIAIIASQTIERQIPVALNVEERVTEEQTVLNPSLPGLTDGVFYAQKPNATSNGYIDYVEIEVTGGRITRVQWDAFNTDRTTKNRRDASLSGYYADSGESWATQSYNLCHALMDLQDPSLIAMKSDGTTDIVEGVTTNIRAFIELVNECIDNSRAGFDKQDYLDGLDEILTGLFSMGAEDLGLLNSDGYVVYSFEDYPNLFTAYDEDGNPVGMLTVREMVGGGDVSGDYEEDTDTESDVPEDDQQDSYLIPAEDGVVSSDSSDTVLIENTDGLPMSEIQTFIEGLPSDGETSQYVVTGINETYKFLKEYFNWMA